ncbi:hypothetical protein [Neptunicella marina]|uniref:Solute-binding protein family 3/N-terminal domain-containing protein n=1 Tax=Neptunicella marina TaxID=2125989 RepID=A0A8J6IWE0_9ALTE|nr:hypothetical protein [Neptunicella marina]MBC3766920.1 hypothetical protein [Neptunicella marina]
MRQKFLTRFLPLLIALLAFTAHAQDYPKSLTISYVKHQAVIKLYKPLIEKAYAKLGIKVNFLPIDIARSLTFIDQGKIDGDVIRASVVTKNHPNLIAVTPTLTEMDIILYCQKQINCGGDALNQPNAILGLVGSIRQYHDVLKHARVSTSSYVDYQVMKQAFEKKRLDYMLGIKDKHSNNNYLIGTPYQQQPLFKQRGNHILHKKWAFLIPALSKAIVELQQNQP